MLTLFNILCVRYCHKIWFKYSRLNMCFKRASQNTVRSCKVDTLMSYRFHKTSGRKNINETKVNETKKKSPTFSK